MPKDRVLERPESESCGVRTDVSGTGAPEGRPTGASGADQHGMIRELQIVRVG